MKIGVLLFLLLMCPVLASHAQQEMGYSVDQRESTMPTASMKGAVVSVTPGDLQKDMRAELRLTSETGESWFFLVASKAVIKDKDGHEVGLNVLKPGDQVALDYVIYRYSPKRPRVFEIQSITIQ